MRLTGETTPYRIGWKTHPSFGNKSVLGHRTWALWHRPWQAESASCRFARRAFTGRAAQRKIERDAAYFLRTGRQSLWQRYRRALAWFGAYERNKRRAQEERR